MNNFKSPKTVLLLGDSITQYGDLRDGFTTLLREHYQGKLLFQGLGVEGINTHNFLKFVSSDELLSCLPKPEMICHVIICLGANDAAIPEAGPAQAKQHVPLEEYKTNMSKLVGIIK